MVLNSQNQFPSPEGQAEYPSAAAYMMAAIVPAPPLERSLADSTDVAAAHKTSQDEDNMDSSHVAAARRQLWKSFKIF